MLRTCIEDVKAEIAKKLGESKQAYCKLYYIMFRQNK